MQGMLNGQFQAVPGTVKVKPAFQVRKLEGTVKVRKHIFDKKNNKIRSKLIEEDAGYEVTFARGHKIRCKDEAHLRRIGAGYQFVPLVDENTGDTVGAINNIDDVINAAVDEDEE
jgi:hypothetical protein